MNEVDALVSSIVQALNEEKSEEKSAEDVAVKQKIRTPAMTLLCYAMLCYDFADVSHAYEDFTGRLLFEILYCCPKGMIFHVPFRNSLT